MKKVFYYIRLKNVSPLHIGNGDSTFTDDDLIKDKEGSFYIPGTGMAGSIVHYLSDDEKEVFFPAAKDSNGKVIDKNAQCPVYISDAVLSEDKHAVEKRDGIQLTRDKITVDGAKYDYEILPAGYEFVWRVEIVERKPSDSELENIFEHALAAIENHNISIGFKTTRGLGRLEVLSAGKKTFDEKNIEEYFRFNLYDEKDYADITEEIKETAKTEKGRFTKISVPLTQKGGISIRAYNTEKGDADYEHIKSAGRPVIPGTSWNGLLRHKFLEYAEESGLYSDYGFKSAEDFVNYIFGYVVTGKDAVKEKSRIQIEESVITGGDEPVFTRNRINPFSAATVNGALYKERTVYGGKCRLNIMVPEDIDAKDLVLQFIKLFINDLHNGFAAIGGETSIGRGMFTVGYERDGKTEDVLLDGEVWEWRL